jgi:hypothetical protein
MVEVAGRRTVEQPGFGMQVVRDDKDAVVVMVFTRDVSVGGSVTGKDIVKKPFEEARKIFERPGNPLSKETMNDGFEELKNGPVTVKTYQMVIRRQITEMLSSFGYVCSTSKSTDNDEILMPIGVPRGSAIVKTVAHNCNYSMAATAKSYKDMPAEGSYFSGHAPPVDDQGFSVPANLPYDLDVVKKQPDMFQKFKDLDEVRMVIRHLTVWMSISELKEQDVISRFFISSTYEQQMNLQAKWAGLSNVMKFPNYENDDLINDYFGEQISFFFIFVTFFTRGLGALGVFGFLTFMSLEVPAVQQAFGITMKDMIMIKTAYLVYIVLWSTFFVDMFRHTVSRRVQRWGMSDGETDSTDGANLGSDNLDLSSYQRDLEGTALLKWRKTVAVLGWWFFVLLFVLGTAFIQAYKRVQRESGGTDYSAIMLAILMKGGGWVWTKVAPKLSSMQNHKTDSRWLRSTAFYLITVKLFIAVWPLVNLAFVQKFVESECGRNKRQVLKKVYGQFARNWPSGLPEDPLDDISWANAFFFKPFEGEGVCMYGCIPKKCQQLGIDKVTVCQTQCVLEIEETLVMFFAIQLLVTLWFVICPIVLLKVFVWREQRTAAAARVVGEPEKPYSMLELQAKREELTPYRYNSWGGSLVEDFADIAIAFMTLVAFGNVVPVMATIAFLSYLVVYRLYAYRMALVTGRPYPLNACGIGIWQQVFEISAFLAVVINVGYLVTVEHPFRGERLGSQMVAFLVCEHCVVILRFAVKSFTPHEPDGVRLNRFVNNAFVEKMTSVGRRLNVPSQEKYSYKKVQATLNLRASAPLGDL